VSTCKLKDLIPIRAIISELPPREDGRPYDPSTVVRWGGKLAASLEKIRAAGRRHHAITRQGETAVGEKGRGRKLTPPVTVIGWP
jgi:hypothetical protein